jgi:hypothetical protein
MAKTWEEMTPDEKVEDLRKDVTGIFRILTELRDAAATDVIGLKSQVESMKPWGPFLNQLQQRIEKIEKN